MTNRSLKVLLLVVAVSLLVDVAFSTRFPSGSRADCLEGDQLKVGASASLAALHDAPSAVGVATLLAEEGDQFFASLANSFQSIGNLWERPIQALSEHITRQRELQDLWEEERAEATRQSLYNDRSGERSSLLSVPLRQFRQTASPPPPDQSGHTCSRIGVWSDEREQCICPRDRQGKQCEKMTRFRCSYRLLEPVPHCESRPVGLGGAPRCLVFRKSDKVHFRYMVECAFDKEKEDPLSLTDIDQDDSASMSSIGSSMNAESQASQSSVRGDNQSPPVFDYFVNTTLFAVSRQEQNIWTMALRVFDFTSFSDLSASLFQNITASQLSGTEEVVFELDLASVKDNFLIGGRLYYEAGLWSESVIGIGEEIPGLVLRTPDRRFVDFVDYIPPVTSTPASSGQASWVTLLVILASLSIVLVILYIMWGCYRQIVERRSRKRIDREVTQERREQLRRGYVHQIEGLH